jgi:hypothetical protein
MNFSLTSSFCPAGEIKEWSQLALSTWKAQVALKFFARRRLHSLQGSNVVYQTFPGSWCIPFQPSFTAGSEGGSIERDC